MDFVTAVNILAQLYANYRSEKDFKTFIEFNDLGLPLAFLTAEGLILEVSDDGKRYIMDTFEMFIHSLKLDLDDIIEGMNLDDVLEIASSQ